MEVVYNDVINALRVLRTPLPANQLGVRDYYLRILNGLLYAREIIDDTILFVNARVKECDDTFSQTLLSPR